MKKLFNNTFFIILFFILNPDLLQAQVFVNQTGYINKLSKIFFTTTVADSFYVVEASTGIIFYRDELTFSVSDDPATGLTLYRGDFSLLQRDGNYFIRVGNIDSSFVFTISQTALDDVYKKSLKGFYFQRCGLALLPTYAGLYYHPSCHLSDATFHSSTGESGQKQTTGGWHDAGDYGKYVVNAGITVGSLLMAYEMFPAKFNQDNLNIPESGNGVPDILDEVRYELEWLLKMQSSNGGVYFKVTKEQFESIVLPNNDSGTRYIYTISSTATGDFSAVMARAARLYKNIDAIFADKCLNASELAWSFLVTNPTIIPTGGFKNPASTFTGEYGDVSDSDERLWASAELFETTGEATYKNYFESHYSSGGIISSTISWANVKDLAQLTYLDSKQVSASSSVKLQIKTSLISSCNSLVNNSSANGFGVSINPGGYFWGSNSDVLNKAMLLIFAYEQTNNINYYETALMQLNYILGTNAHNISFVTGVGSKSVMHPHHRPSWADGIVAPVPGLLAGGPNQYLDDDVLKRHFNSLTPPALCYIDSVESYASNEIAINWNAPLVFVLGYFSGDGLTSVDNRESYIKPKDFMLEQNYPNPFNPNTKIRYTIPTAQNNIGTLVQLIIYDILGNEVATLVNEYQPTGAYMVEFNSSSKSQSSASGIYFYRLKVGEFIETKKMVLLR
jgi:endoglucanase